MADKETNDDSKYVVAYDSNHYQRDEKSFIAAEKTGDVNRVDFSGFSRLMIHDLCSNSNIIETGYIGCVKLEDARRALQNPNREWRVLLSVSDQLMKISPHYFRLNRLYSNMALFCWWLDLYGVKDSANKDRIKDRYAKLAEKLEDMNLKFEFAKIMEHLPSEDIYCGLVEETEDGFFFQKVNFNICKLYQIQDGIYNFRINLSGIKGKELGAYPDYVQEAYLDFIEGKKSSNWYLPPPEKQICIKLNTQWTAPYPILIGLINDILDLDIYKKLKLQSARTDNYKAILIQVPIASDTVDKPLLTPETLGIFAEINRENMSDDIGMIHTLGSDAEAISFKDSANTTNNVSDAVDEIYNSSGQTKEYYNGSSSGTAVTFSAENDSGFVYKLYRQFEQWVNRYIKLNGFNTSKFKFKFYLLDITIFNRDNVSKRYKEAVSLGVTCIDKWLASLDMTPSITLGSYIVHNDIFDFYNNFKPLSSSYNGSASESGESEAGRPTAESKGELLDEEGQKTADNESNDR